MKNDLKKQMLESLANLSKQFEISESYSAVYADLINISAHAKAIGSKCHQEAQIVPEKNPVEAMAEVFGGERPQDVTTEQMNQLLLEVLKSVWARFIDSGNFAELARELEVLADGVELLGMLEDGGT